MKTIIAGSIAVLLGVNGLGFFLPSILEFWAGVLPMLLLLGGGMAMYMGYSERKSQRDD